MPVAKAFTASDIVSQNFRSAEHWSRRGLSEVNPRAREQEVGADHEPEGVIADDRYLDEHARDRKHHRQERDYNPNVHCAYLLALTKRPKPWLDDRTQQRDIVATSKAASEIRRLTSMLHHSQCACV